MIADFSEDERIHKLLLLGAGESGKSTLFKQMIAIYGNGFPEEERKTFDTVIFGNIISSLQNLLAALPAHGEGEVGEGARASLEVVEALRGDEIIDAELGRHILVLWDDAAVQKTYDNRSKFQLTDSAAYFFERLRDEEECPSSPNYLPTEQDVLRSRVRTTGIVENTFTIDENVFKMFDVGGQRNERKKWIHCFENVTAVLFVGVLSEYDQVLYEDENTNRMDETLNLFKEIVNSQYFINTSIILFLNKRDLFAEKIQRVPLSVCPVFADREDIDSIANNYDDAVLVIEDQFRKQNEDHNIYSHVTCATDTGNIQAVFNAVKDIIIRKSLGEAGLV